jgi:hypothetical protein
MYEHWQDRTTLMGVPGELVGDGCALRARNVDSAFIQTHLSLGFLLELMTTGPFTPLPDEAVAAVRR